MRPIVAHRTLLRCVYCFCQSNSAIRHRISRAIFVSLLVSPLSSYVDIRRRTVFPLINRPPPRIRRVSRDSLYRHMFRDSDCPADASSLGCVHRLLDAHGSLLRREISTRRHFIGVLPRRSLTHYKFNRDAEYILVTLSSTLTLLRASEIRKRELQN